MQQEDDLRALAKIMEFGRAVSIFILVVHVYVYCYPSMSAWHLNLDVIDRILMNFDRTTGIFGCILWTKLMENEYSVNLPTRFQYGGKLNDGWINVVNPFRATIVLGTPGSGKSYAVVNNYIKQMISKGFSVYIYDYKFDDLSTIAYNTLLHNMDKYKVKPHFYVINFDDPHRSHRCNPINPEFMTDISDAYEASYTIMLNLNKTWV